MHLVAEQAVGETDRARDRMKKERWGRRSYFEWFDLVGSIIGLNRGGFKRRVIALVEFNRCASLEKVWFSFGAVFAPLPALVEVTMSNLDYSW